MNVKIISDSSSDIMPEFLKKYDIELVPFLVSFDGEVYKKENEELMVKDFYQVLRTQNVYPKTSLPSIQSYEDVFRKYLDKGNHILCFTLTSKFSGSYQSAANAAEILREEYPTMRIEVVDSMQATFGQGSLVLEAAQMLNAGKSIDETIAAVNFLKQECRIYVTVDSLTYLQKGGRIGKASALTGGLLNIKPVIAVRDGELIPLSKVRGRKKAIAEMVDLLYKDIGDRKDMFNVFVLSTEEDLEGYTESADLQEYLMSQGYSVSYPVSSVGVTIGAHIGPTTLGLGYIRKFTCL